MHRRFMRRAKLYGFVIDADSSTRSCKIYRKSGVTLMMFSDGIPMVSGIGDRSPGRDVLNELQRIFAEEAGARGHLS